MNKRGKILIIDDEIDLLETISFRLKAENYEAITALDGVGGFKKAMEEIPDVIVLDIMMPAMDGFETLKRLKSENSTKKIPVIVLSCAKEEEEWAKRAIDLGANGYLVKPFDKDSLLFTIERFVKKS